MVEINESCNGTNGLGYFNLYFKSIEIKVDRDSKDNF